MKAMFKSEKALLSESSKLPLIAGAVAVIVSLILVIAKAWAWLDSGATSILAAMIDSGVDILISASTFAAILYASKPADHDHRYGHGKAEGIAALFQAAFILASSIFVFLQALRVLTHQDDITDHQRGIAVMFIAIVLNLALVLFQGYVKRKTNSLAIEADQAHYTGDIIIHLGVILSLYADAHLGWRFIDPICAVLVCLWLLYNAKTIATKALNMLLDRELEDRDRDRIIEIIKNFSKIHGAHDLRTRRSGSQIKMALDIEVNADLSLRDAHDIAIELEQLILEEFPKSEIMIHIDPYGQPEDARHNKLRDHLVIDIEKESEAS